jgi:HlyD family secretion protein
MKKVLLLVIVLLAIGGIVAVALMGQRGPKELAVTAEKATRGDITSIVTSTGRIFPETEVRISSEVSGEIIELPVLDGMRVNRGDLLVRVDPEILESQAKQQAAALAASRATSQQAYAQMLQAELNLKRIDNLFAKGFATQDQVDEARTTHEVARASHAASLSRIEQQQMQLEEAEKSLSKASTFAPISGTITVLNSELGDRVVGTGQYAGTEVMRIADLDRMEVRVAVSEADIVNVKIGDEAEVEIDAIPDTKFRGEVSEIANSASTSGQGGQDQLTTFEVKVRLLEPSTAVRPGMTATADIKTQTVTEVVRVPLQAVTVRSREQVREQLEEEPPERETAARAEEATAGEGTERRDERRRQRENLERIVFVVEDGKAVLRRVKTGIADNRWIEIEEGLADGEQIVTGGYRVLTRELEHGTAVKIEERAFGNDAKRGA